MKWSHPFNTVIYTLKSWTRDVQVFFPGSKKRASNLAHGSILGPIHHKFFTPWHTDQLFVVVVVVVVLSWNTPIQSLK